MLYTITSPTDKVFNFITDDPVRPHIPAEKRYGTNKDILYLSDDEKVKAITCISYQDFIPQAENDLFDTIKDDASVAVFYTIWSYEPGAGRKLIFDSVEYIKENLKNINRFVTLSPKTEMAFKFHTKNGAILLRENLDTINYEYLV
jgi:hypothetical protein